MLGLDSHEDTVMYKIHLLLPKAVKHWTLDVANIINELIFDRFLLAYCLFSYRSLMTSKRRKNNKRPQEPSVSVNALTLLLPICYRDRMSPYNINTVPNSLR